MNIHEYQAKQIFKKYGVPTPKGIMAESDQTLTLTRKINEYS